MHLKQILECLYWWKGIQRVEELRKCTQAKMLLSIWMILELQARHLCEKWQVQGDNWLLLFVCNDPSCMTFQERPDFKYSVPLLSHVLYHVLIISLEKYDDYSCMLSVIKLLRVRNLGRWFRETHVQCGGVEKTQADLQVTDRRFHFPTLPFTISPSTNN